MVTAGPGRAALAARALLDLGLPNDAVSRLLRGLSLCPRRPFVPRSRTKSHRRVLALLERSAREQGWLSRDAVTRLAHLQSFRSMADYDARISLERAREEATASETFIAEARGIV